MLSSTHAYDVPYPLSWYLTERIMRLATRQRCDSAFEWTGKYIPCFVSGAIKLTDNKDEAPQIGNGPIACMIPHRRRPYLHTSRTPLAAFGF